MSVASANGVELASLGSSGAEKSLLAAKSSAGAKGETELPAAYLQYLSTMKEAWPDLPDLTISYKDFGYSVQLPVERREIPNLYTAFRDGITGPFTKVEKKEFKALSGASGVVRPGELTLVLSPPGHGKSLLLKGLAGRLQREAENLRGSIKWNGLTSEAAKQAGFELNKLTAFVEQGDVHFPMLTVRETFAFALRNSNADSTLLGSPDFDAMQAKKVDLMLELLGLKECAETIVGNTLIRGVSGGQKKRVTLGEMMISQARALFLDEISTGLDSAATFDIVSALKRWTRVMRGSAYVALLQPAPEVFNMFDNIILLRDGQVLFSGTKAQLEAHFQTINIAPNEELDFADWLTEFLASPVDVWRRDLENKGRASSMRSFRSSFREAAQPLNPATSVPGQVVQVQAAKPASASKTKRETDDPPSETDRVVFHLNDAVMTDEDAEALANRAENTDERQPGGEASPLVKTVGLALPAAAAGQQRQKGLGRIITAKDIPLSTAALRRAYEASTTYKDILTELSDIDARKPGLVAKENRSDYTHASFYSAQSRSLWHHTLACLERQKQFMTRSPEFIGPRIGQSIFMGLVIGSLFWQLGVGPNDFSPRFGLILFALINTGFSNMAEIPLASEFKLVVYKQVDAGFYSVFSYIFSVVLMHMPLAITECTIFATLLWWMAGFAHDAGRFFFFILLMLSVNLAIGAMFRAVAYLAKNPDVAMNLAGPSTAICLLFGGFLITADKIPDWCIWLFWLSPFSWALRSGALNEMRSDRYDSGVGDAYLNVWQIDTNNDFKWGGIAYLAGFFIFWVLIQAYALKFKRTWLTTGTRRGDEEGAGEDSQPEVEVRIGAKTTSMVAAAKEQQQKEEGNQIQFDQMDLSWQNLRYTVQVQVKNEETGKEETKDRLLLNGINGFARAGELTALMGSSGAGKTTLMDVIAGRKTSGKIEGDIFVNGHKQTFPTFARLNGYCEQVDIHTGTDTVREAIEFSARLRLPSNISDEARTKFVDQILEDLELTGIAGRLIGDANIEGLSPGELKRVTIGVELASNPVFLFLDEPTSGLDSRAALIVLRVIRKIARRGRSVICTIHQPSAELFCMFDRLLLLKSGGKEVYFGPVGDDGVDVVRYFMDAPIGEEYFRPAIRQGVNPASWMLDVIGAGTSAKGKIADYSEVYKGSALRVENEAKVAQLCEPRGAAVSFDTVFANSYSLQFKLVLERLFTVYWRDTSYNSTKFFLMVFLGCLFGLVYVQIDDNDEPGLISKISVMYMAAGFMGVLQSSNSLPVVFRLREVFYRERASNVYAPWVYSTALSIVELPYLFFCTALFVLPFYFIVGFENNADLFFRYLAIMYVISVFFGYMGQLFASLLPNIQVANILQGTIFTFFFLFGGIFIQRGVMPKGWLFMYYIDPIPKALISLCIQQYYCNDVTSTTCPTIQSLQYGRVTKWNYLSEFLVTGGSWEDKYFGWLLFSIFVVVLLKSWVIQKVSHLKR